MKFLNIYNETEENLRLALLSLWTPGRHPMRGAIEELFDREPLTAEPVFQSTFGWEVTPDASWKQALNPEIIRSLRIGREFDPYKHQAQSWETLKTGKSIVVTSGTGSGKTECFMYPVISDLYEQGPTNAIQAIFLYPLNALMEDQKSRLSKYCDATGLQFGVYNGSTPEYRPEGTLLPGQVGTRDEIRDPKNQGTRPQILLSNPSMLEYILVRQKDQHMLAQSKGKLRWIVIDEAHSYSGSAALELENQIKRILEAFDVKAEDVRFACTSATIGGPSGTQSLKDFISTVIGRPAQDIEVIGGNRVIPDISLTELEVALRAKNIPVSAKRVLDLRQAINNLPGIPLNEIWQRLNPGQNYDIGKALNLIDELCDLRVTGKVVLSLRGHFFMRAISGLYVCANQKCSGGVVSHYGYLTTYKSLVCPECGRPLLELVQCPKCGSFILMGQYDTETHIVSPCVEGIDHADFFAIDEDTEEEESLTSQEDTARTDTFFALPTETVQNSHPLATAHKSSFDLENHSGVERLDLKPENKGSWSDLRKDARYSYCPKCGKLARGKRLHFKYFRIPINFINQTISPAFLKENASLNGTWGKYIAFTDSRQGTAISAKTFNIDVERRICRMTVVDKLAELESNSPLKQLNSNLKYDALTQSQRDLVERLLTAIPDSVERFMSISTDPVFKNSTPDQQRLMVELIAASANGATDMTLHELADKIFNQKLFRHIAGNNANDNLKKAYEYALVRTFIGQKLVYRKDAESLGILTLDYTKLKNAKSPHSLNDLAIACSKTISDDDWRDFLKICLDFGMRAANHIQPLISDEREFIRESNLSSPIAKEKWAKVRRGKASNAVERRQSRLVLLLCAALGIDTLELLERYGNTLDRVLEDAWIFLEENVLTKVSANDGYNDSNFYHDEKYLGYYYLDLSPADNNKVCTIKRPEKGWICPATGAILDTVFCGYSPAISGEISKDLFYTFKVDEAPITLPDKPADLRNNPNWQTTDKGIDELKSNGLWTDRHKYAYQSIPAYIAAEHSAQQSRDILAEYTQDFIDNRINVLHCSTTMEMGVDIGDIDIVLMDTVPPTAANYLQRVGRAGRMGQTKSVAFSLCNNSPVGQRAFADPMWALKTINHMVPVKTSQTIIQRHVNSYFFRQFICGQGEGINITTTIGEFMGGKRSDCEAFIDYLDTMSTEHDFIRRFHEVFGVSTPFTINRTIDDIKAIRDEYNKIVDELETAHSQFEDDMRRRQAIAIQLRRYKQDALLNYLSEHQFIPNANMPTGVCIFDFMDARQADHLMLLFRELDRLKDRIEEASEAEVTALEIDRRRVDREIQALKRSTQATRDIHTALNEYAPGQTVVVNEKNYVSAGVSLLGAYNDATQTRAIYFCKNCGHTEYTTSLDETRHCPKCGDPYHAIIGDSNNISYTRAYEPIGFRTDQNVNGSREERTEKKYYDINPVLLDVDWSSHEDINLCEVTTSGETGEILFYNAGNRYGFAFCKRCGRAALEVGAHAAIPFVVRPFHKQLWRQNRNNYCDANENDIARHVVFTGRLQTCYSVLRFKRSDNLKDYEKDKSLAYSLGVMIRRALCEYLGIDESEIDFGCKEELEAISLFVYDTARGGCGYSLHLGNPQECAQILEIARKQLSAYACDCHLNGGACSQCLIDRGNYRMAHLLDKAKVNDWLSKQRKGVVEVPKMVLDKSREAKVAYRSLTSILKSAVSNPEVAGIVLYASDSNEENVINDWVSTKARMGHLIHKAVENAKNVEVMVYYHPALHTSEEDRYPYATLNQRIPDTEVTLIEESGTLKTALLLKYRDGKVERFFTDSLEGLSFSNEWGNGVDNLYVDSISPKDDSLPFPVMVNDPDVIIREGLAKPKSFSIKNYFTTVIAQSTLQTSDIDRMKKMLMEKHVSITFSDMYVNSALASLMLAYLIKEIKDLFGLKIDSITLRLDASRRKCTNERYNHYTPINHNWPSPQEADEYTFNLLEDILDVVPDRSRYDAQHHRYLRIVTDDGFEMEIRPDHSISGGWKSSSKYMDAMSLNGDLTVWRDEDILYYVILKNP